MLIQTRWCACFSRTRCVSFLLPISPLILVLELLEIRNTIPGNGSHCMVFVPTSVIRWVILVAIPYHWFAITRKVVIIRICPFTSLKKISECHWKETNERILIVKCFQQRSRSNSVQIHKSKQNFNQNIMLIVDACYSKCFTLDFVHRSDLDLDLDNFFVENLIWETTICKLLFLTYDQHLYGSLFYY